MLPLAINDLITLGDRAVAWLNKVTGKKEQRAAKVLISAGLLVGTLRLLDNLIQKIFGGIKVTVQDLTEDQRKKLVKEINDFARNEVLLKKIRIYSDELEKFDVQKWKDVAGSVAQIKSATENILGVLGIGTTPFSNEKELEDFLSNLRHANNLRQKEMLNKICKAILSLYDRNVVAHAEHALGTLRGSILNKYPRLPYPDWI